MAADPIEAMARALAEADGHEPDETEWAWIGGEYLERPVWDGRMKMARAAWKQALDTLDNAEGSALVEVIEFLEHARNEILPG